MNTTPTKSVFFLSDYGIRDEFVGVVHAVLAKTAPGVPVIDLTHRVPPFDVRAGANTLVRAIPHLGPGVVLAVVDPGVGSGRRGLCLEVPSLRGGPAWFVGPDNGLLVAAAELAGGGQITRAFELHHGNGPDGGGATFDGRDLFAPAAAALAKGTAPDTLGQPIGVDALIRLLPGVVEYGRLPDGRRCLRTEVTWVDHFGNIQLAVTSPDAAAAGFPSTGSVELTVLTGSGESAHPTLPTALVPDGVLLRCVRTFADLESGALGLLIDANDHLALVAGQASAAHWLNVMAGELMLLVW